MSAELNDQQWTMFMNGLVVGCIGGMKQVSESLNASTPGVFPPVDDGHMFDAAVLLLASLIDANPDYADSKQFGKAADTVRKNVLAYTRQMRDRSEAQGRPILYSQIEAAIGKPGAINDR